MLNRDKTARPSYSDRLRLDVAEGTQHSALNYLSILVGIVVSEQRATKATKEDQTRLSLFHIVVFWVDKF
jgi:hypothetical protein